MLFYPALLAVGLVIAVNRIGAKLGAPPALATLILTVPARAVLLIRILGTPPEPAATTLAAAAHWNLPVNGLNQEAPV
jgi:hypothetical protein